MTPDEIYDTYVDFNDNLELDINAYNMLKSQSLRIYSLIFHNESFKEFL